MAKKAVKKKRGISDKTVLKYRLIIDEYFVNGFNGTEAYKALYPNIKKSNTAAVNFKRISELEPIKQYITEKHEAAARKIDVTHSGMLEELKNIIELDITDTIGLTPEQIKDLPIEFKRNIAKYKHTIRESTSRRGKVLTRSEYVEITLVSKERALESINKHIGFYEKDNQQKAPVLDYSKISSDLLNELTNAEFKA